MNTSCSIVWLRADLRLGDHPALQAAIKRGGPVIPVFIYAPEEEAPWQPGAASRWWLHQSLVALDSSLRAVGTRLVLRRGPTLQTLRGLISETGAGAVFWNRRYEPAVITRDTTVREVLAGEGVEAESFAGALLHEPWTIENGGGKPYRVFTAFWRTCQARPGVAGPLAAPRTLRPPARWPKSLPLEDLELEPKVDWAGGVRSVWHPGENGARAQLERFLVEGLGNYDEARNRPDVAGTSRLSPHLHFGEITPRQIWHEVRRQAESNQVPGRTWRTSQFLSEIGWREFAHHLLYHFPYTPTEPLRGEFNKFSWHKNGAFLEAWQKGRTGYPIVDAGMRELWATGWMHNRVRMIVASFLVKDLLLSWGEGASWFWDTLVDADLAQNTMGWQWSAGCGADAAPYFRVFNPVIQGEKFDPAGTYVRRWCPELGRVPSEWIHKPWQAPSALLESAGVRLGRDYPTPLVSHTIAREAALEAFARLKGIAAVSAG